MGYRITEPHVRVRTNLKHEWIWELVTGDGHVASVSDTYADRERCEAEARSHGLRIVGGKKQPRERPQHRRPGVRVYATSCGVWCWENVSDAGEVLAGSATAFLTKEECERDAARCLGIDSAAA